jgi:hypothetical protein
VATVTDRLGLILPDDSENYDVGITNGNFTKLEDAAAHAVECTSITRPGAPDVGDIIFETDTGKLLVRGNSAWDHVGTAIGGITLNTGKQLNYGASASGAPIAIKTAAAGDQVLSVRVGAETTSRLFISSEGRIDWADGTAVTDVGITRVGAGTLRVLGNLQATSFREVSNARTVSTSQNVAGTTVSTTYSPTLTGGTTCSGTFIAPASGEVIIHNTAECFNAAANFTRFAIEVRSGAVIGSGTAMLTAVDDDSGGCSGTNAVRATNSIDVIGLTPGATYNFRQLFRVQSGSNAGTYLRKRVIVCPLYG